MLQKLAALHVLNTINRNKRIRIFSAEIFAIQVASLSILLVQSQVVSLNHFGGSSTAVCAFMENLFAKNFPGLFTIATNGDYRKRPCISRIRR